MKLDKSWITRLSVLLLVLTAALGALLLKNIQNPENMVCFARRSAIDMGSGSSKLLIADVDTCAQKLKRIVHSESQKVDFKQSLLDNDNQFTQEIQSKGMEVLQTYLALVDSLSAEKPLVISTEAFRQARNSVDFLERVKSQLNLEVNIIDQSAEANLGFLSALAVSDIDPSSTLVWDIGGASQQFSYLKNGEIQSLLISWGSISFKAKTLAELGRRGASPNPFTWEEVLQVKPLASVSFQLPQVTSVIGVGGVFNHSLLARLESPDSKIHRVDLDDLLARSYFLTDSQIGGAYAETDITNIIMVLSMMEQLNVTEVLVLETGLLQGVLVYGLSAEGLPR